MYHIHTHNYSRAVYRNFAKGGGKKEGGRSLTSHRNGQDDTPLKYSPHIHAHTHTHMHTHLLDEMADGGPKSGHDFHDGVVASIMKFILQSLLCPIVKIQLKRERERGGGGKL